MKKLLAMVMAVAMTLSLAACGGNSTPAASGSTGSASSAAGSAANTDFKVGAIYINSKNDTAGYTYAHHNGITTAMKELGLDPDSQLVIVDEVNDTDYDGIASAVDTLVAADCNIIFGISFGYMQAMADKAQEYPDVIFSHATGYMSNNTNFNNYFGRIYQARYLAGVAAGLKSLETGNNNLGYVSAFGTEYAETCSGINGFTLGAQAVNPNAKVYVKELGAWADEVNESAFAKELIQNYNCGVISQHCDSAQPQIAAQDAGVFGCGYNSDMTADAPKAHLTAAIWNWNVYYHTAIQAAMDCNGDASQFVTKMGGSAYYGGLAEDFVDVSPLNETTVAPGTDAAIEAVKAKIASGEWDVFSGVKLHVNVNTDGTVSVDQADEALVDNEGNEIVAAGGPSVEDSVITGSMNYFVAGVEEA
ncbi:BMP family ABC transporter substrate-binding protein [Lawsonibacter sp. LCP25S3_F5]